MRVAVLMSTYQGSEFVREQVDSILSQLPSDGRLIVRDDGSRDGTPDLLRAIGDPRIEVTEGENLGAGPSFMRLLAQAPADAEVVMLADQDDVWLPGKIARACEALRGAGEVPTLYFARQYLVDRQLRVLGETPRWPRGPSFTNALCENIVTGCTLAINPPALALARQCAQPARIFFHDWWIYLIVSAFGRCVMDDGEPGMLYRQHGGNVVGRGRGIVDRYLTTLAFIRKRSWIHILFEQVEVFRASHGAALDPAQRRMVERFFDPHRAASILRLLAWPVRRRQYLFDELTFRALLVAELLAGRGLLPRPPGER